MNEQLYFIKSRKLNDGRFADKDFIDILNL